MQAPLQTFRQLAPDKRGFRPPSTLWDATMNIMLAHEAKNALGLMIDTARAEPVLIEKHGRGVVVVIAVEEYERFNAGSNAGPTQPECIKYTGFSVGTRRPWGRKSDSRH
jgi:prevent-host-death family protein